MIPSPVKYGSKPRDEAPAPSRNKRKIILRGPLLWSAGASAMIFASVLCCCDSPAVLAALWVLGGSSWTLCCAWLFWNDLYRHVLRPTVLDPALEAASQWSLDDVLQFLCDPHQLAAWITGAFLLPVTLYSLPTTPEQRAQVLRSAGVLSGDGDDDE